MTEDNPLTGTKAELVRYLDSRCSLQEKKPNSPIAGDRWSASGEGNWEWQINALGDSTSGVLYYHEQLAPNATKLCSIHINITN